MTSSTEIVKVASQHEIEQIQQDRFAPYVNRFIITTLKNGMVKLGWALEYAGEVQAQPASNGKPAVKAQPAKSEYIGALYGNIQDMANLHNLLGRLLQSFQAEQQRLIQEAQAKVNPAFLDKLKALEAPNADFKPDTKN